MRQILTISAKITMIITLWLTLHSLAHSQQIYIGGGTQQRWAGGVCCRHGVNYNLSISIHRETKPFSLDTIWIDGQCHAISGINDKMKFKNDTTFQLQLSIFYDDRDKIYQIDVNTDNSCYDPNKMGVRLIYTVGRTRHERIMTDFLMELESIAYP